MEWVAALRGRVVGLDTTPLLYFIEENPAYLPTVHPFFEAVDRGEFAVVTSIVTLLEVLVHPFRQRNTGLMKIGSEQAICSSSLDTIFVPVGCRGLSTWPATVGSLQCNSELCYGFSTRAC